MPIPELDVGNPDPDIAAQAEENIQALVAFLSRGSPTPEWQIVEPLLIILSFSFPKELRVKAEIMTHNVGFTFPMI